MNLKSFLWTGRLEGISFLLLMFLAVPMKHLGGNPLLVRIIGPIHGALFLMYVYQALKASKAKGWSSKTFHLSWIFACLPFGTFIFEKKYLD